MRKYFFLLYTLLFASAIANGQFLLEPHVGDSLKQVWTDEKQSDTARLEAIYFFAWDGYIYSSPDSTIVYGKMFLSLAESLNNDLYQGAAYNCLGTAHYFLSNYEEALAHYKLCAKFYDLAANKSGQASALSNSANVYKEMGDFKLAIKAAMKGLKIREELSHPQGEINSLEIIGTIYSREGDTEKAKEYFEKCLQKSQELGDLQLLASAYTNIASVYYYENDLSNCELYTQKGIEVVKELGDLKVLATMLANLAEINISRNNLDQAALNMNKSLELRRAYGDMQGVSVSLNGLAAIFKRQNKLRESAKYDRESMELALEINARPEALEAASSLWKTYKDLADYKRALKVYETYISIRDSLQSEENQKALIQQEFQYQYEKQAAADSVKAAEAAKVKDAQLAAEQAESKKNKLEAKQQEQQKYFLYGGLALALLFGGFIFNRFRVTSKQKGIIEEQKVKVDEAFGELEEKNTEILDSINYAKRIQSAILPPSKLVKEYLQDSFILYKPKDIVAGDFYWLEPIDHPVTKHTHGDTPPKQGGEQLVLFAAADCTGHGVPGAMVSVVCNNGLNRSVREYGLTDPGKILDKTREIVISEFRAGRQAGEKSEEEVKDGMDIALCSLSGVEGKNTHTLKYAGAHNPLWIIRKGSQEIEEIKANKQPIGKFMEPLPYTTHTIELNPGDSFYIFSDGYADQFGGDKGKKLKAKNFKTLLLSIQNETMERQRELIDEAFEKWKGSYEQLDDVCVIGVRV